VKLAAFQRITLEPGQSTTVTFDLPAQRLSYYDETVHKFVVKPGTVDVMVGAASDDIRAKAKLTVTSSNAWNP
jgi:beta-glucosidase